MPVYHVEVIEEHALTVLKGLEQLRAIVLRPVNSATSGNSPVNTEQPDTIEGVEDRERIRYFKALQGSLNLGLSVDEIDRKVSEIREGWL